MLVHRHYAIGELLGARLRIDDRALSVRKQILGPRKVRCKGWQNHNLVEHRARMFRIVIPVIALAIHIVN